MKRRVSNQPFPGRPTSIGLLRTVALLLVPSLCEIELAGQPLPSGQEIMERVVTKANQNQNRAGEGVPGYRYRLTTVTEELDHRGTVKERKETTREVRPPGEALQHAPRPAEPSPHPGTAAAPTNASRSKTPGGGRGSHNFLTGEVLSRFKFDCLGRERVDGRSALLVAFQPRRPNLPAQGMMEKVLNQTTGRLWIDEEEAEIAKAEVKLQKGIPVWGGLIASLKGFEFTLERTRLEPGLWLNRSTSGHFEGRKLLGAVRVRMSSEASHVTKMEPD